MAPEQEARERAFYDHESDEPHRHRRPAADWGVGEDIFDRMPSRRFTRADRRAEHHADERRRAERPPADERRTSWGDDAGARHKRGESMTIVIGRDDSAPAARRIVVETDDFTAVKPVSEFAAVLPRADTDEFVGVELMGRELDADAHARAA